jgi:hypothetical protein
MFGINNARDFYQKLVQEFDDFCEAPSSARHAMNFVITAYHLHEWVWKSFLKNDAAKRQALGIRKDIDAFKAWLDERSIWYAQMQPLANGSKHFQPGGLTIRVQHIGAYNTFAYNELAYNEGYSYLVVDLGMLDGVPNVLPATFLFEVVVRFWRDFLRLHGPYPELPKGRTLLSDEQSIGQPQASPSDTG